MNCPHCDFSFRFLAVNSLEIPAVAPSLCENCSEVSLLESGVPRKMTDDKMAQIKLSPVWRDMIEPARRMIGAHKKAQNARNN